MDRPWRIAALGLLTLGGCATVPDLDNPIAVRRLNAVALSEVENPVLLSPGQHTGASYAIVFDHVLSVMDDFFEIKYANPYDGRIVSKPSIAPGLERLWKPGSSSGMERLIATFQTIRYRGQVQIRASEGGGYLVDVVVFRELLDDIQPIGTNSSPSSFRDLPSVERQFEVVDDTVPVYDGGRWIPKGREHTIEQAILRKLRESQ